MFDQNLIETKILPLMHEVSKMCKESFLKPQILGFKNERQVVNNIDLQVSDFLINHLQELFPEFGILSEESQKTFIKKDFNWIIDPLDGSTNFSRGIPLFCSQIALEHKGEIIFACVVVPQEDKLLHAIAGQGVYCNGVLLDKPIKSNLNEAVFVFDSYLDKDDREVLDLVADEVNYIPSYNSVGLAFAYLALGRVNGVLNFCDRIWDIAPGVLFALELGFCVTDKAGEKVDVWPENPHLVVALPEMHSDILNLLN